MQRLKFDYLKIEGRLLLTVHIRQIRFSIMTPEEFATGDEKTRIFRYIIAKIPIKSFPTQLRNS